MVLLEIDSNPLENDKTYRKYQMKAGKKSLVLTFRYEVEEWNDRWGIVSSHSANFS